MNRLRHIWIVRSKVLYILAGLVITLAIGLQAYASWTRWHVRRINANAVACKLAIDFGQAGSQEITFVPFCSRQYNAYLVLRGPIPERAPRHRRLQGPEARAVSLKAGTSYRLVLAVEEAAQPLNEFQPVLIIRTAATLKGRPIAGWRITDAALMAAIGGVLTILAVCKRRFEIRNRREAADRFVQVKS